MFAVFFKRYGIYVLFVFLSLSFIYSSQNYKKSTQSEIAYSNFKKLIATGGIKKVSLSGDQIRAVLRSGSQLQGVELNNQFITTHIPIVGDEDLLRMLEAQDVEVNVSAVQAKSGIATVLAMLPFILFVAYALWFARRMRPGGLGQDKRISQFLNPSSKAIPDAPPNITFDDVAGQETAKQEVSEVLDYIRNPEDYRTLGASVPKGILLMGPPGTGKTLLARALAGEAGVPFCSVSASEFIEMYVGVGAARVRALFNQAKEKAPSIIFIDELDAIGRMRGTGMGGGNDEREQTLNQILSEMDGFAGHETVIVLAATNRPDVLDPALLRPGRFDRHVTLELPDIAAREAILKVHTKDVPLAKEVDLHAIASETPGFSGADLKNLVNEAAMYAARQKADKISSHDFEQMRDKVVFGSARKLIIQPSERHRLAVHEAGHTAAAFYLPEADPIHKVTIIPRGSALGATQQLPENERYTLPLPYLKDRLAVMLAGRAAEQEILGTSSSGADDDIKQATALARAMVTRWGMSELVGPVDLRESDAHPFLGREISKPRVHSEASAGNVDKAVKAILLEAQESAAQVINANTDRIMHLVDLLEAQETLDREAIINVLGDATKQQVHVV
ncbi:MAG: cell division protease FtsH [Porticoccaceae bacterium]|jgi:cell division protease FtsH